MSARFEVVRTDAEQPWHARFIAKNGRIVWTTEQHTRRKGALNAIYLLGHPSLNGVGAYIHSGWLEIRDVDERSGQ